MEKMEPSFYTTSISSFVHIPIVSNVIAEKREKMPQKSDFFHKIKFL